MQEVYDYDLKLFMLNYQDRQNPKKGQVNVIYDLNVGIGYNISRRTSQCEIFPVMPNKSFITTEDSSHHLQMKTAQELFFGLGASTFLGSSNVRGIEVEIWSFKRNSSRANMMVLYMYNRLELLPCIILVEELATGNESTATQFSQYPAYSNFISTDHVDYKRTVQSYWTSIILLIG